MQPTRKLINTLGSQQYLRFYEIMHYPVPTDTETYFQYSKEANKNKKYNIILDSRSNNDFSREKKCNHMDEYLQEIKKLEPVFKSIPYIDQIFLCNSITFNALNDDSDIDLFIISKPDRIRTVKFRSMLLFSLKGVKRFGKSKRKKICLSFFITSDSKNLYSISLKSLDIYLCYWISHLVLIYQGTVNYDKKSDFFSQNKRVKGILPNYTEKQTIQLGIKNFSGDTKLKKIIEFVDPLFGDLFELIFKATQKSIISIKNFINPTKNKDVIISDNMLKFHQDVREKISLKYNVKTK